MKNLFLQWRGQGAALLLAASTLAAQAAADVKTLGGGPNQTSPAKSGATDGDTFAYAKFRNPFALALDTNGSLLVADYGNNKVRKVSKPGAADSLTSTFASRLPSPSGIAVDASNFVYVVTYRDGKLRKFNGSGALMETATGYKAPTGLALGPDGSVYVSELKGNIYKGGNLIATGFLRPRGLAALADGSVVVAESTGHALWRLTSTNGINYTKSIIAGGSGQVRNPKGLLDGTGLEARFNSPYGLALAPNGSLVVADRLNHRLRVIDTNNVVTSLYGVLKSQWFKPFSGWADGEGGAEGVAASRDPIGVTVSSNGTVFVSEIYWDLLRQASGTGLGSTNSSGSDTNGGGGPINTNLLVAPLFAPTSGYFPFGATITVTSTAPVYYTTDGTEPTTNSAQVVLTDNVGSFRFTENLRDLTSLRLKAISDVGASTTVGGQAASANEIGIPRDFIAGSGARILVPIVANLRANARVQSFQYRVEITPQNGAPAIEPYVAGVPMSTNDFVPIVTAAAAGKTARYTVSQPYFIGDTIGVVVTAFGTNAFIDIENFATTALLMVPVSGAALEGDTYRIRVLEVSATSDGYQQPIALAAAPARTITVQGLPYLVGDVAVGPGYNAGEFGDGDLRNNDVNAVMFASFGIRVPFAFSDAFNAMDVHPTEPRFQGNLEINFFDWQVVLARSLRLNTTNVTRVWNGGLRQSDLVPLAPTFAAAAKSAPAKSAPAAWSREVKLRAGNVYNQQPGVCEVPVSIHVAPGFSVGGLGFRLTVENGNGVPMATDVSFEPFLGTDGFISTRGSAANDLVCAWSMVPSSPFSPLVQSNQALGVLRFTIPPGVGPGTHYKVRFSHAAGGPDLDTPLTFETVPGSAWAYWTPAEGGQVTSDEWRVFYFGSVSAANAADSADPDGDGLSNAQEYANGTNPTTP